MFTSESSFYVFDKDLNYADTLFGGKLMAEIDCEAAKVARRIAYSCGADNAVTVNFYMDFIHPGKKGDLIIMKAEVASYGKSSVKIDVKCILENKEGTKEMGIGKTTFVILKDGKPFPHNLNDNG